MSEHYVDCPSLQTMKEYSPIYDPNGNAITYADLCVLINTLQDDCLTLKGCLENILDSRNEFDGPSLDYMQGYRNGQQYLQGIAQVGLGSLSDGKETT